MTDKPPIRNGHAFKSAKQAETRARRIRNACEMLAGGKKRVCCFDRSGYYSKGSRDRGSEITAQRIA